MFSGLNRSFWIQNFPQMSSLPELLPQPSEPISTALPQRAEKWSEKFSLVLFKNRTVLEHMVEICECLSLCFVVVAFKLFSSSLCAGSNEKVYEGKGVGKKYNSAAAKLYANVLKHVGTHIAVKGGEQPRMAPMISGTQLQRVVEQELARYEADCASVKTGEGGEKQPSTLHDKNCKTLLDMMTQPAQSKEQRDQEEYRNRVTQITDKVRSNVLHAA